MSKKDRGFPFNDGTSGGVSRAIVIETPNEATTMVLRRGTLMFFGAKSLQGDAVLKDLRDALNDLYPPTSDPQLKGGLD